MLREDCDAADIAFDIWGHSGAFTWEVPARTWRYDPLPLLIITSVRLLDVAGARTAAPTVGDVQITSNAGDDGTYVRGESIHVTLTFRGTVEVTGTPQRVAIALPDAGGQWQQADSRPQEGPQERRLK